MIMCFSKQPARCRPLTEGEKAIAASVFGDTLQLDSIRLETAWWVLKGYAVSPNGHVYFHPADFCDDFSQQNVYLRAWLVHEQVCTSLLIKDNNYKFMKNGQDIHRIY